MARYNGGTDGGGISIANATKKKIIAKKMRPVFNPKTGGAKGWTGQTKGGVKDAAAKALKSPPKGKGIRTT